MEQEKPHEVLSRRQESLVRRARLAILMVEYPELQGDLTVAYRQLHVDMNEEDKGGERKSWLNTG